jgi:hypothetical protein
VCERGPKVLIHSTKFSSQLPKGHNNLGCYITKDWKCSPETSALAYWDHLQVTKERKCYENILRFLIHSTSFSSKPTKGPHKLECYINQG